MQQVVTFEPYVISSHFHFNSFVFSRKIKIAAFSPQYLNSKMAHEIFRKILIEHENTKPR